MDESTRTDTTADESAQDAQLDDQQVDTSAENQPDEQNDQDGQQETVEEAVTDENLAWLQKKGVDPSDPEAMAKVAKMYREAEKAMHSNAQEKAQLKQSLTQTPDASQFVDAQGNFDAVAQLQQQVQSMRMEANVDKFFSSNPDAKAYEESMIHLVSENPNLEYMINNEAFSLQQLYQLARGADPSIEAKAKTEGGREALQKVADKQQAKAVTGKATSSAMSASGVTKANFDEWYAGLSPSERSSSETQNIVASLLT